MNIDTITPDDFMKLDAGDHAVAIYLYSQRITLLETKVKREQDADSRELMLDEVRRCQNLRKVHVHALHELLMPAPKAAEVESPTAAAA